MINRNSFMDAVYSEFSFTLEFSEIPKEMLLRAALGNRMNLHLNSWEGIFIYIETGRK